MPISVRPVEPADITAIAVIRAQRLGTESFWTDRIDRYLRGEHSPQQALSVRAGFVAMNHGELLGFVTGHLTRRFGWNQGIGRN
jgi:hypothetical protein